MTTSSTDPPIRDGLEDPPMSDRQRQFESLIGGSVDSVEFLRRNAQEVGDLLDDHIVYQVGEILAVDGP
jgi:hypothetical protein